MEDTQTHDTGVIREKQADEVCDIYCKLYDMAYTDPEALHTAPHNTPVRRLDEVGAARNMVLRYNFGA